MFSVYTTPQIFKNRQQPLTDLCLRKTRSGRSRDFRDAISFRQKLCFPNLFQAHEDEKTAFSNELGLKNVSKKPRFSNEA